MKEKAVDIADDIFVIPDSMHCISPSLAVIPLQLLSYYVSVSKGLDIDKFENLAKSVMVEQNRP